MQCVDKCENDTVYKYEFNNDFCIEDFSNDTIYNETKKIYKFPKSNGIINAKDFIILTFQENIIEGRFDNIINNVLKEGMDYIVSTNNIIYQITTTDNQKKIKVIFPQLILEIAKKF